MSSKFYDFYVNKSIFSLSRYRMMINDLEHTWNIVNPIY